MKLSINRRFAVLALLVAYICLMTAGCSDKQPSPEDTIFALQDAINNFDADTLLNCIHSKWANQIRLLLGFLNEDANYPFLAIAKAVVPALPLLTDGAIPTDSTPNVVFTILQTEIEGDEATVSLSGTLTWGEYEETFPSTVTLQIEEDIWVITGIR